VTTDAGQRQSVAAVALQQLRELYDDAKSCAWRELAY
jgi:hypothetical protein